MKHALRVSLVLAAAANVLCKYGLWLIASHNKTKAASAQQKMGRSCFCFSDYSGFQLSAGLPFYQLTWKLNLHSRSRKLL